MSLKRVPHRVPPTTPRAGLESRLLVEYMREMQVHEIFTYAEMREYTGEDIQKRRDLMDTARTILRDRYNMIFKPINGVGYIRLDEGEKVRYAAEKTTGLARGSLRNLQLLAAVDLAQLTPVEQGKYYTQQIMMAAVHLYTHEHTRMALEDGTPPPVLTAFDREAHARLTQLWGPG
jgi:hypothetical protein